MDGGTVPSPAVLRMRGLPFTSAPADVRSFFQPFKVQEVYLCKRDGRLTGEAYVVLPSMPDPDACLSQLNKKYIGSRYIELFESTEADLCAVKRLLSGPVTQGHVVRLRGLPYSTTEEDVRAFLADATLADVPDAVVLAQAADGRPSGEAYAELADQGALALAMMRHKEVLGGRYIEVFTSSRLKKYQAFQQVQTNSRSRNRRLQPLAAPQAKDWASTLGQRPEHPQEWQQQPQVQQKPPMLRVAVCSSQEGAPHTAQVLPQLSQAPGMAVCTAAMGTATACMPVPYAAGMAVMHQLQPQPLQQQQQQLHQQEQLQLQEQLHHHHHRHQQAQQHHHHHRQQQQQQQQQHLAADGVYHGILHHLPVQSAAAWAPPHVAVVSSSQACSAPTGDPVSNSMLERPRYAQPMPMGACSGNGSGSSGSSNSSLTTLSVGVVCRGLCVQPLHASYGHSMLPACPQLELPGLAADITHSQQPQVAAWQECMPAMGRGVQLLMGSSAPALLPQQVLVPVSAAVNSQVLLHQQGWQPQCAVSGAYYQ